jgi:hypothetical protein
LFISTRHEYNGGANCGLGSYHGGFDGPRDHDRDLARLGDLGGQHHY